MGTDPALPEPTAGSAQGPAPRATLPGPHPCSPPTQVFSKAISTSGKGTRVFDSWELSCVIEAPHAQPPVYALEWTHPRCHVPASLTGEPEGSASLNGVAREG